LLPAVLALLVVGCPSKDNPSYNDAGAETGSSTAVSSAGSTTRSAGPTSGGESATESSNTGSPASELRIFVSSVRYSGDLGGLEGADEKCTAVATAAGLSGQWMAWVSDDIAGVDAIDRIQGEGPWVRTDGVEVFSNRATLMARPSDELAVDEDGEGFADATMSVWTGTQSDGTADRSCLGFTSETDVGITGNPRRPENWTSGSGGACELPRYLYCFEQP
jgi:hypothetical protein